MKRKVLVILIALVAYVLLGYIIPFGNYVLYPVVLFVTFLHELGHSFFAIITGGNVSGIQINTNGSGFALISGGFWPLILAGGYLGSALFGNVILYIALVKEQWSGYLSSFFMVIMLLTGIFLYQSVTTSIILFLFATVMYVLVRYFAQYLSTIHSFLGCASILYIFEDFWHGPASDLAKFGQYIPFIPPFVWAFVWLSIALYMTYYNVRYLILND